MKLIWRKSTEEKERVEKNVIVEEREREREKHRLFSLNDREGGEVKLNENESSKNVTIAAKFLTKRALNTESVVRTFNPIWRSKNGFKVRNVGNHTILFIFDNEEEVKKIMEGEPWSFDKHLVMIKRYDYSIPIKDLVFDQVSLWVQVHDIPIKYLSREVAEKLCEAVGEVNKESSLLEVDRGNVMRIRVKVNTTLPLCRGRIFTLENGSKGWVSFKYERLPNVCYWCGRLNHFDRDCERWLESSGTLTQKDQEYGPWLRASPLPASTNSMIIVPGFYEAKKKELNSERERRQKANFSAHGSSDTAAQEGAQGGSPLDDRSSGINAPIMEDDVMDVTQKRVATGGNSGVMKLDKETENKGDYFEKKIKEIDTELMRFELQKESSCGRVSNKETDCELNGVTDLGGVLSNQAKHGLAACEAPNREILNHVLDDEGNPTAQVNHVPEKSQAAAANLTSTWKRIVRKEVNTISLTPPLTAQKRSRAEVFDAELPRKKKQVSQDDQNKKIELAVADNQHRQGQ
uniref:CCHC-type domain-containing protein n=1 Tax=Quercus lobata TaxID=97700 RepID=A0A7N2LME0_QUELO